MNFKITLMFILFCFAANLHAEPFGHYKPLAAYKSDSLWYFINYDGKQIFPPIKLNNVLGYSEGMYCVSKMKDNKEKWGYLDSTGKFAIEPKYDKAMPFSEGFAVVYEFSPRLGVHLLISFIDKNGNRLNKEDLIDALSFSEGLAFAYTNDNKSGYINSNGEFVIDLKDLVGNRYSEGLAVVTNYNLNAGYIDNSGNKVIPLQYESAKPFSEGFAAVSKNSKYSYLNKNGDIVIDGKFDIANLFKENRAFVGDVYPKTFRTLWGLIDTTGKFIKDYCYSAVWDFSESVAAVRDSLNWGFIDYQGNYIFNPTYTYAASFVDGLAWVSKKDENIFGYINIKEEFVVKFDNFEKIIDLRLNRRMF